MSGYLAALFTDGKERRSFHTDLDEGLKFWMFMLAGAHIRRNLEGTFKKPKPLTEC